MKLSIGTEVIVKEGVGHFGEFSGTVKSIVDNAYVIEDQDEDCWEAMEHEVEEV